MGYNQSKKGRGPYSLYIPKPELEQKYVKENIGRVDLAGIFGVSKGTIDNFITRYGLTKGRRRGNLMKGRKPSCPPKVTCSPEEFRSLRVDQGLTNREVAELFKTTVQTISSYNKKWGVTLSNGESNRRGAARSKVFMPGEKTCPNSGYRYLFLPSHHRSGCGNYIEEHRVVVEKFINRNLDAEERIHHINMVKTDNRIQNLAILGRSDHSKVHRYYERVGVYLCGLGIAKPAPLSFSEKVLWAGEWTNEIDLCIGKGE